MRRNAYYHALVAELAARGVSDYWVEPGKKHMRLVFRWQGVTRFYPYPRGSDNENAAREAVKDLRHMLGVKRHVVKNRQRRDRSAAARQPHPEPARPLSVTLLPDPWAPLSGFVPLSLDPEVRAAQRRIEDRVQLALYRLSFHPGSLDRWQRDERRAARRKRP